MSELTSRDVFEILKPHIKQLQSNYVRGFTLQCDIDDLARIHVEYIVDGNSEDLEVSQD